MEGTLILFAAISFVCGSEVLPSPRVNGGTEQTVDAVPYLASIKYDGKHFCTGALIRATNTGGYVVTAAHCVKGLNINRLSVRVGALRLDSVGKFSTVSAMYIHSQFNKLNGLDYDVAVLRVPGITPGSPIGTVTLVNSNIGTPPSNCVFWFSGWGSQPNSTQIGTLRRGTANFIDAPACRRLISTVDVTDRMICSTGTGGCYTDDGGPLVCIVGATNTLWGIFSWSSACNNNGRPQVYTDVRSVRDFLEPFGEP